MSTVLLNGEPISVGGQFPRVGDMAHSFMLVDQDLKDVALSKFDGKKKVIIVVPSLDTEIGLRIARRINNMARDFTNTVCLIISVDTPYAQARVAAQDDLLFVKLLSTLRGRDFHKDYGLMIIDYPLAGMMATAAFVLDEHDTILSAELVHEVNSEPNYQTIAAALQPPPLE